MKDGKCAKRYPKQFCDETRADGDGYPVYRRRDTGRYAMIGQQGIQLDNRWVVPYNPFLSSKFNCHINVEICSTISSVKYLYKYVYKGQDRTNLAIGGTQRDEIQQYIDARYLSPPEACWRILEYPLQAKSHSVERLPVHLMAMQYVTFQATDTAEAVRERSSHTKLTRFFDLCARDPRAQGLLYHQIPEIYVWNRRKKDWTFRTRSFDKVGRMVAVPPSDVERYYMRLLLCYVRGPVSFDALKTVDGTVYQSYKAAAAAAGLVDSDEESDKCLREATLFQMPRQLRNLFATLLVYCHPTDTHLPAMSEDIMRALNVDVPTDPVVFQVLKSIQRFLLSNSRDLTEFEDLPQLADFTHLQRAESTNRLIQIETSYNPEELMVTLSDVNAMTDEQRQIYDEVLHAVNNPDTSQRVYFVDGPGGTGKSFLMEKILAKVRLDGGVALAVASSGIAAQLLTGGRTAHSRFKIKLDLDETSTFNIPLESDLAALIRMCKLIVWDEALMIHRYAFESVDRTFQAVMQDSRPFGGKVVLLGGDFRQILPVVPRANDAQIISACIQRSPIWHKVVKRRLTVNMRLRCDSADDAHERREFSGFLMDIGNGSHSSHNRLPPEYACIPQDLLLEPADEIMGELINSMKLNIRRIVDHTYGDIAGAGDEVFDYLSDRAILTPLNVDVEDINNEVLRRLPGDHHDYLSIDSVECEEEFQRDIYPIEFLNTISVSGLPPHRLRLKVGASILLMRNLDPENGLCNGTRLLIRRLASHCIHATIMNGTFRGHSTLIPRISLISSELGLTFQIKRKQIPVQVAFALTINKAQGQSISKLEVYLPQPVFSHGQLYVALSRATSRANVRVLIRGGELPDGPSGSTYTRNIVYRELLQ